LTMIILGPSLTGLRGTQVMGSIIYTLVKDGVEHLNCKTITHGVYCGTGVIFMRSQTEKQITQVKLHSTIH
jgi:hypothetical protein